MHAGRPRTAGKHSSRSHHVPTPDKISGCVHATRKTCATLLAALDVHPRVAMRILRHVQIEVTMDVYTEVSDEQTLRALKRLGDQLDS